MTNQSLQEQVEEIKEKLAAIEHERWSDWQKYVSDLMGRNSDGWYVLAREYFDRWQRQIATPYSELSDQEKASDIEQVDRYWPLIMDLLIDARIDEHELVMGMSLTLNESAFIGWSDARIEQLRAERNQGDE